MRWLAAAGLDPSGLAPLGADASMRRYFRLETAAGSRVVMDAPDQASDFEAFLRVGALMRAAGLHAPRVDRADPEAGVMLLEDLGDTSYLAALKAGETADRLVDEALSALVRWQAATETGQLPPYDAQQLQRELDLFPDWYVTRHLGQTPGANWWAQWQAGCEALIAAATAQPQVWVHRDFMARNLMVSEPGPGVIDFQDALLGPVTYDLVSLLRDAFIDFPADLEQHWVARYADYARQAGVALPASLPEAVDLMGAQRHLKVLGIFARLAHRDGKSGYLADAPRFLAYLDRELAPYPDFAALRGLISDLPVPGAVA